VDQELARKAPDADAISKKFRMVMVHALQMSATVKSFLFG